MTLVKNLMLSLIAMLYALLYFSVLTQMNNDK